MHTEIDLATLEADSVNHLDMCRRTPSRDALQPLFCPNTEPRDQESPCSEAPGHQACPVSTLLQIAFASLHEHSRAQRCVKFVDLGSLGSPLPAHRQVTTGDGQQQLRFLRQNLPSVPQLFPLYSINHQRRCTKAIVEMHHDKQAALPLVQ